MMKINKEMINKICDDILKSCTSSDLLFIGDNSSVLSEIMRLRGYNAFDFSLIEASYIQNKFISMSDKIDRLDKSFDTIVIVNYFDLKVIDKLRKNIKKNLYIYIDYDIYKKGSRKEIEEKLFSNGFRKHPMYCLIVGYSDINEEDIFFVGIYEKLDNFISNKFTLTNLKKQRNLHMDMTREYGVRSDGHIIRYVLATEFVQSGDTVLDCACGYGYGTYILSQLTNSKICFGVDITDEAIDYANESFCSNNLQFKKGDAQQLNSFINNSIDFITSFETLEHIPDPEKFLMEAHRILKPGGRIIVSVPYKWLNEKGEDPSPYHLHTYDWEKLKEQIGKNFYIEKAWELTMDGYFSNGHSFSSSRKLKEFSIHSIPDEKTECLLLLAMKDPLSQGYNDYVETAWREDYGENHHFVDFKNNYINPYIWKVVLSSPHRDVETNIKFCQRILEKYPNDSADYGGALCYLSYRLLELDNSINILSFNEITLLINEYLDVTSNNSHVYRWKISLAFVLAKLYLKLGDLSKSKELFVKCISFDPNKFSPTIATKLMLAYEYLCIIDACNRIQYWEGALKLLKHIFSNINWSDVYGDKYMPVPYGLNELSEIFKITSRIAWRVYFNEKPYPIYLKNSIKEIYPEGMSLNYLRNKQLKLEKALIEKEKARENLENILEDVVKEKEKRIGEYENSLSWKITRPLRVIKSFFVKG